MSGYFEVFEPAHLHEVEMLLITFIGEGIDADSATRHEDTLHLKIVGIHQLPKVIQDDIHAILMEVTMIAEGKEIELEALALNHALARYIGNIDVSEVRLPGLRTESRELRAVEGHKILTVRVFVLKSLEQRGGIIGGVSGALIAQQGHTFKFFISTHKSKNFYGGLYFRGDAGEYSRSAKLAIFCGLANFHYLCRDNCP